MRAHSVAGAGLDDPDKMIRDIPYGIYAENICGGTGGEEFTLLCPRASLLRNGKLDYMPKSAMPLGRGDEMMLKIDRV